MHEAGTNRILFSVKFKVLPSKNTIVASETIRQFGALVEHIMKNDGIRVNGHLVIYCNSIKHTIESSSEVQKTGVTPTRQTLDLTHDIFKGHLQRLEQGTSEGPDSRTRQ